MSILNFQNYPYTGEKTIAAGAVDLIGISGSVVVVKSADRPFRMRFNGQQEVDVDNGDRIPMPRDSFGVQEVFNKIEVINTDQSNTLTFQLYIGDSTLETANRIGGAVNVQNVSGGQLRVVTARPSTTTTDDFSIGNSAVQFLAANADRTRAVIYADSEDVFISQGLATPLADRMKVPAGTHFEMFTTGDATAMTESSTTKLRVFSEEL